MASGSHSSVKETLLVAAQKARDSSYSPYSKFRVGAALLLKSGKIIPGANIENASYGAAICAERTALVHYASSPLYHGKPRDPIIAIAVSSDLDEPCSPCGICRQFIREFCALDMPVLMVNTSWTPASSSLGQGGASEAAKHLADPYGEDALAAKELLVEEKGVTIRTLEQLLPLSFGPEQLER